MTRAENVAAIQALRQAHPRMPVRQQAALLGITESAYRNLFYDPDGSKQRTRRKRYQGACVNCGRPTDGSNGKAHAPRLCAACTSAVNGLRKRGTGPTEQRALAAIAAGTTRFTDIGIALGITKFHVAVLMNRLVSYGLVERVSRGQYRVRDAA